MDARADHGAAQDQLLPATPAKLGTRIASRKRWPRFVGAMVLTALVVIAAVSAVQVLTPPYTSESVAAAVQHARGAQLASCDQDNGVDGSWTCQLAYAQKPSACAQAQTGARVSTGSCAVKRHERLKALELAQREVLHYVTQQTQADGERDTSPPPAAKVSKVSMRGTWMSKLWPF